MPNIYHRNGNRDDVYDLPDDSYDQELRRRMAEFLLSRNRLQQVGQPDLDPNDDLIGQALLEKSDINLAATDLKLIHDFRTQEKRTQIEQPMAPEGAAGLKKVGLDLAPYNGRLETTAPGVSLTNGRTDLDIHQSSGEASSDSDNDGFLLAPPVPLAYPPGCR